MVKYAQIWICLVFLLGCGAERRAFQLAAEKHGGHIAAISAFADLLSRPGPALDEPGEVAWRYAAQAARAAITRHATASYDVFGPMPRPPRGPAERIGAAFLDVRRGCALHPAQERRPDAQDERAAACQRALQQVNLVLAAEDRLAQRAGLPAGTFSQIGPAAITPAAAAEAAALRQRVAPSPAEQQRRALWRSSEAQQKDLQRSCEQSLKEARAARLPDGVAREIFATCTSIKRAEELLQEVSKGSPRGSLCATLRTQADQPGMPAALALQLRRAAAECRPPG